MKKQKISIPKISPKINLTFDFSGKPIKIIPP